jgi:F0F1-type ATP synthase epsilon subunit
MILKVFTPDQDEIVKNDVDFINVHLSSGYPISIYPRHIQLTAALEAGTIKVSIKGLNSDVQISQGLLIVENDVVSCYVSWADSDPNG